MLFHSIKNDSTSSFQSNSNNPLGIDINTHKTNIQATLEAIQLHDAPLNFVPDPEYIDDGISHAASHHKKVPFMSVPGRKMHHLLPKEYLLVRYPHIVASVIVYTPPTIQPTRNHPVHH